MSGFNTKATHSSDLLAEVIEQPLSVPIFQSADYAYESAAHYADVINERRSGQVYGRYGGPTVEVLAKLTAILEGAESGWAFSSGMGAIHACLMHVARAGDRIIAARTLYGGTYGLFTEGAAQVGISVDFVDATEASAVEEALERPAVAVFVESVPNPTFEVSDIEGIGAVCRATGIPLIVDNTVPTPALCNPLEFGAELVVHATSKYIGGHHDLMGGAVVGSSERIDDVRHRAIRYGTTASALEAWLAIRGAATLGLRMERHSANAIAAAELFETTRKTSRVLYPGLASHPQHSRARKIMRGYGGMMAVDLGSAAAAHRFMDSVRVARVGSSFGGVRSELTHPATTSHRQFSADDREAAGISDGLIRVSIGLEDIADLLDDFESALEVV